MSALMCLLQSVLAPYRDRSRWIVAYSGGLDSRVLLELLCEWRDTSPEPLPPLEAIHIDHRLQRDSAQWAVHCREVCRRLQVPLHEHVVSVDDEARRGLEARARNARYRVFEQALEPGELLLMAHHRDDQVETVLLRMLRGSGLRGLRAIPARRPLGEGELFRPLLGIRRSDLEAFARERGLEWIEDGSNADRRFDRNYLRHAILPRLASRWPAYRETIARVARHAAEGDALLEELAEEDLARVGVRDGPLPLTALRRLSPARQRNALRRWLRLRGIAAIGEEQIAQLAHDVMDAAADAAPLFKLDGRAVRRYRGRLYVTALPPAPPVDWHSAWNPPVPLVIPGAGVLKGEPANGEGLRCAGNAVTVSLRRGGERCRPAGRRHSQTLKKLLQEYGVPPWWRDRLPLIYIDGELAAVADLWICEGFVAAPGERGWQLCWERAP